MLPFQQQFGRGDRGRMIGNDPVGLGQQFGDSPNSGMVPAYQQPPQMTRAQLMQLRQRPSSGPYLPYGATPPLNPFAPQPGATGPSLGFGGLGPQMGFDYTPSPYGFGSQQQGLAGAATQPQRPWWVGTGLSRPGPAGGQLFGNQYWNPAMTAGSQGPFPNLPPGAQLPWYLQQYAQGMYPPSPIR